MQDNSSQGFPLITFVSDANVLTKACLGEQHGWLVGSQDGWEISSSHSVQGAGLAAGQCTEQTNAVCTAHSGLIWRSTAKELCTNYHGFQLLRVGHWLLPC